MPRGRTCKFGRNTTTRKCNRNPVNGSPKARGRPCKNGRNSTTGKCNGRRSSPKARRTKKVKVVVKSSEKPEP